MVRKHKKNEMTDRNLHVAEKGKENDKKNETADRNIHVNKKATAIRNSKLKRKH